MKISVAMPTYKRLPQLKKAVASVQAQTHTNWELVISDDEKTPGETWAWLQEVAKSDPRIRVIRNEGEKHGQIYNVNNALRACTCEWVKPLFDDDRMLPDCLAVFADAVERIGKKVEKVGGGGQRMVGSSEKGEPCRGGEGEKAGGETDDLVLLGCRAQRWRDGKYVDDEPDFTTHDLEFIPREDALLAMCQRDLWNGRTPTHCMMRVRFPDGAFVGMVENADYKHQIDVRWFGRLLERGGVAMTNKVLVCECQGECESGTSTLWKEEGFVSQEARRIYCEIWDRAEKDKRWPSRRAVDRMICGLRGVYHLRKRQFGWAIKYLALMMTSFGGIRMTVNWLRRKANPGRHTATKRQVID